MSIAPSVVVLSTEREGDGVPVSIPVTSLKAPTAGKPLEHPVPVLRTPRYPIIGRLVEKSMRRSAPFAVQLDQLLLTPTSLDF